MKAWELFVESRRKVKLVPLFSQSCKPFALQTCKDVHPCRPCGGRGCKLCNNSGVSKIRRGSAFCCMICHKSGKDHMRALMPVPVIHPDPKPAAVVAEELHTKFLKNLTRKERRALQFGE